MEALLRARGLTKRYGKVLALDRVDFEVQEAVTGLLGPNGSGKSTTIKLFLGLIEPTGGTAEVLGEATARQLRLHGHASATCPSTTACRPMCRGGVSRAHGARSAACHARTRARARPTRCATSDCSRSATAPIGGYSTGMKQRVKLAQALVHDPVLVFLDEPPAGLDPAGREEMLDLIRKTHREFGISLLLSSHIWATSSGRATGSSSSRTAASCTRARSRVHQGDPDRLRRGDGAGSRSSSLRCASVGSRPSSRAPRW